MLEKKYIELLVKRCLRVDSNTPLFISYNNIIKPFVKKVEEYAKSLGISDIYLDEVDSYKVHDVLMTESVEEIKNNKLFDNSIWDVYAKKNAAFLLLESEIPKLMDDVDSKKVEASSSVKRTTKPIYKDRQLKGDIPWCIAAVPNELWAKSIFKDSKDPLKDFWHTLSKLCLFDKGNAIKNWDKFLKLQFSKQEKLNDLKIKKLHYKNSLGTDLTLYLSDQALWSSASSGKWIVNIPSYEIFTTPIYDKTEGIVYSSKPLIYNGKTINNFYLKFHKGKVVEYHAESGNDVLTEIINSDKYSCFLGEAALVDYDSPISNTNKIFNTTLIDENASCHLALGSGFMECFKNNTNLTKKELQKLGMNVSDNHVDFMIGTSDLLVEAETDNGIVTIMKDGNMVI